jgi:hypothetical protein
MRKQAVNGLAGVQHHEPLEAKWKPDDVTDNKVTCFPVAPEQNKMLNKLSCFFFGDILTQAVQCSDRIRIRSPTVLSYDDACFRPDKSKRFH